MISVWLMKAVKPVIILALLILVAIFLGWLTISTVHGMVDDAVARTVSERNAHWKSEIEAANTKVAEAEAEQARHALNIERDTTAKLDALRTKQLELETQNAALPNGGDCGLGRDRVRLLPH